MSEIEPCAYTRATVTKFQLCGEGQYLVTVIFENSDATETLTISTRVDGVTEMVQAPRKALERVRDLIDVRLNRAQDAADE